MELNPNSSLTYYFYALHLFYLGRLAEAEAAAKRALQIDPLSPSHNTVLGALFIFNRQYDVASDQSRKTLEMEPDFAQAHAWLAVALFNSGNREEGIAQIQKGLNLSGGDVWMRCLQAAFEGLTGQKEKAMAHLQEILSLTAQRYVSPVHLSQVYFTDQRRLGNARILGKGSAARAENRVARLEPGHVPAHHFNLAGHVMTEPTGFRGRGLAQPEQYSKDVRAPSIKRSRQD